MHRVVYMSRANQDMSDAQLDEIREIAARNNAREDVTGLLVYVGDTFFQILEGPRRNVQGVFDRVYMDDRHSRVRIMYESEATSRRFSDWSMGFCRLSEQDTDATAFFELSRAEVESRIPPEAGEKLITLMRGFVDAKMASNEPAYS